MIKKTIVALREIWRKDHVATLYYCANLVLKLCRISFGLYRIRGRHYRFYDRGIATLVIYKEIVCGLYDTNIPTNGRVLDVGAHVGMFAIPLARENPTVQFLCLEPNPRNYRNLSRNITRNKVFNVAALPLAVGVGSVACLHNFWNSGASKVFPGYGIDAVPLDHFGRFDLMKVDIEGAEYQVIRSKDDWSFANEMIIEVHTHPRQKEMLEYCKGARVIIE